MHSLLYTGESLVNEIELSKVFPSFLNHETCWQMKTLEITEPSKIIFTYLSYVVVVQYKVLCSQWDVVWDSCQMDAGADDGFGDFIASAPVRTFAIEGVDNTWK